VCNFVCLSVSLSDCTLKGKLLELSTQKSIEKYSPRQALGMKSRSMLGLRWVRADLYTHADMTAHFLVVL